MAVYEVIHGLVLRETEFREADKVLAVLTAEKGKVSVIARGVLRKGSRMSASAQLFAYSEMTVYESGGYYILTDASTEATFSGLRVHISVLALATYFADLTETVLGEGEETGELLSHMLNALYALSELRKPPELVKAAFEMRLMALTGFAPLLDGCMYCGAETEDGAFFDVHGGGLLCRACAEGRGGIPLSRASIAALRWSVTAPAKRLYAFSLSPAARRETAYAAEKYTLTQVDKGYAALEFYKNMKED